MDLIDALDRTFAHAHDVVAGVRPDQYDDKTPCTEWSVRDLLEHMIGVVEGLGAAASGRSPEPFTLGAEPASQFHEAATSAMVGWRAQGCSTGSWTPGPAPCPAAPSPASISSTPLPTPGTSPPPPAKRRRYPTISPLAALDASRTIIIAEVRPGRLGPEVPAPAGATPTEALVAFLGRTP